MGAILLTIALGSGFLHAFYRAVEFQWPTSYFTVETRLGYTITATPLRYVSFRFAPVWVTCLFAAVTLGRVDENPALGVAGIAAVHAASTSGRAIVSIVRGHETREKGPLVALHIAVAIGIAVAAEAALLLRGTLASLVPPVAELSASLWTALLAGVVGAYLLYLSRAHVSDPEAALRRSRATIPQDLWSEATVAATQNEADPNLVHAIMLVENMQRPRWWRWLEQVKGKLAPSGTYGIMQVRSDNPISDEESVHRCVRERLARVQIRQTEYGFPDWDSLREVAINYNPDENFANSLTSAYSYAQQSGSQ